MGSSESTTKSVKKSGSRSESKEIKKESTSEVGAPTVEDLIKSSEFRACLASWCPAPWQSR